MLKKSIVMILILLTFIVGISGCTTKTATNGTFGEKTVSINSILISNNTTADTYNDTDNGTEYYYIDGYLENKNSNDAFNVKVNATAYDANGNVVATNNSAYLNPPTIPAKGVSEFYVEFPDTNNNIVRYDVKIVDATGTL
jgi:uncharacterized membrane protein